MVASKAMPADNVLFTLVKLQDAHESLGMIASSVPAASCLDVHLHAFLQDF